MSDDDLIRRGDALAIVVRDRVPTNRTGSEFRVVSTQDMLKAIAALPAVTMRVKPLVFTEARNYMWNAQLGYRIGWNGDDRYRVKLVDRVICKSVKGFDAAVDWANRHNEARILTALEPVAAPDLTDPVVVHANMLRGTIAKPTVEQIIHLYGVDALTKALPPWPRRRSCDLP